MKPLLSIVIPTRNRQRYITSVIKTIHDNLKSYEIIIQDNSDDESLKLLLNDYKIFYNIKYSHSKKKLSVVDNFESAFSLIEGEFAISIGDDDSIGPGIEDIATWAKLNNVDAIISYGKKFITSYYWPGVKSKYFGQNYEETIFISTFSGKATFFDPLRNLQDALDNLGNGLAELPRVYHGLVSSDLLREIKKKYGKIFGGISPDIYSGVLIASIAKKFAVVDYPFIIPGASPISAFGQGVARTDKGNLYSFEHIQRFGPEFKWDKRIPEFYSPETVWSYSICKAVEESCLFHLKPNYLRLYASCILKHPDQKNVILRALSHIRKDGEAFIYFKLVYYFFDAIINLALSRSKYIFYPRAGANALRFRSCVNIQHAYNVLAEHIDAQKIKLDLL